MPLDLNSIVKDELKKAHDEKDQVEKELAENRQKILGSQPDPYLKNAKDYDDNLKQCAKELTDLIQGKQQVAGTSADGGARTTTAFDRTLIAKQREVASIVNRVRSITADSDKVDLIVENVGDFTPIKTAENADFTEAKLTYDKPRLTMSIYGITDSISYNLLNTDVVSPSLADQITTAMARASVNQMEKLLVQGTTGNEIGLASEFKASGGFANVDAKDKTTTDGYTADDIDNLIFSTFKPEYLANAVIICRPKDLRKLLDFGSTANKTNYFTPAISSNADAVASVGAYRGIPVLSTSFLGDAYTSGGIATGKAGVIVIADLNYLVRGNYTNSDIQFSDHVNFSKAQRVYRLIFTYGSQIALKDAFATLSYRAKA